MKPSEQLSEEQRKIRLSKREALEDSVHRVIAAYIANLGGKVVVSGPIEIQQWPEDKKGQFRIAIHCAGRKPILPSSDAAIAQER